MRCILTTLLLLALAPDGSTASADVSTILQRWTAANRADYEAAPGYDYSERDRDDDGTRTYDVTMLFGSPYKRLVLVDDKPLSDDDRRKQDEQFQRARNDRSAESPEDRARRIAEYQKSRARARRIVEELPKAFDYRLSGRRTVGGRSMYVLQAVPRSGYHPPDTATEVLTGMRGEFWIDMSTGQLVRAVARVIHPVSIEGFLATVQPGTEFELEQVAVEDGIWLPSRLEIRSRSSIVFLFHHHRNEERRYFNYHKSAFERDRISPSAQVKSETSAEARSDALSPSRRNGRTFEFRIATTESTCPNATSWPAGHRLPICPLSPAPPATAANRATTSRCADGV